MSQRILAVASAGGHWIQLCRLIPAFSGHEVIFLTTNADYADIVAPAKLYVVNDGNLWDKWGLVKMAFRIFGILLILRPDVVISTGAAPGYFALRFAKIFGARTIWVDSAANVEELSLAGRRVQKFADLWLTQWPHLAKNSGPLFKGTVL